MKIEIPDIKTLQPETYTLSNGVTLYLFPSASTELVKMDFLAEAGSAYQAKKLVAGAANKLFVTASETMDTERLAEFIDYRGIIIDSNIDALCSTTTFYTLHRHLYDLLPVMDDLLHRPAFPEREFEVFKNKRRQKLLTLQRKSREVARKLFYESLFDATHPLARYAEPEDVDCLDLEDVKTFYHSRHRVGDLNLVVSGKVDDRLLAALDSRFGHDHPTTGLSRCDLAVDGAERRGRTERAIDGAVQTTLRVGRILPLAWNSQEYAQFMVLTTLLGGYFGSRLMSNLREDKGYTYGIYAHTQIYRGVTVFYIIADVAGNVAEEAEKEIFHELRRLAEEPVGAEELDLVRVVMAGDFIRSVDGIFERSARFCDMMGTDVDERLTENLREALDSVTPAQIQQLAARYLRDDQLWVCRAGAL